MNRQQYLQSLVDQPLVDHESSDDPDFWFVEFRGGGGWWAVASDCRWFGDAGEYLGRNWQQAEKTIKYLFS